MISFFFSFIFFRTTETALPAGKLPAVPESVLKRRKRRAVIKATRLRVSIKVNYIHDFIR